MTSTLHCACSSRPALTSVQPEPGLDAQGCPNCQGVLLTLARYRAWRAQGAHVAPSAAHVVTADGGARNCPGCTRLMHRYRVGAQPDFRVDRCAA